MMNFESPLQTPELEQSDALLMDIARRLQLTATQHAAAESNYLALCQWVDRDGSPLHGLVGDCYASGSFAIGAAILSKVRTAQHDVDVVLELMVSPTASPERVLRTLYDAINGDVGSRYFGKVTLNSRCVTVAYADGTTVDLMPIARLPGQPERSGNLFHFKPGTGESYHKPVNPAGFAALFNNQTKSDPVFSDLFSARRLLAEKGVARGDVQPMPDKVPIAEKSARVVALQLLKRDRDLAYRKRQGRKPPSVALAAWGLELQIVQPRLVDEVISIAEHIRGRLVEVDGPRGTVQVFNPAYRPDEFTDRWPEGRAAQKAYDSDLRTLITDMRKIKSDALSLADQEVLLEKHFGETASRYAIESQLESKMREMRNGRLRVGSTGKILGGAAATTFGSTAAHGATRASGGKLPE